MKTAEYEKIIAMAVRKEIEAYDFYAAAAKKVKDAGLKSTLKELAGEEKKHRNLLEEMLVLAKPLHFDETHDYKITEAVDQPKLSIDMKPADAIALAMKKELEAMQMYAELASRSKGPQQKKMFEELSLMEKGHKAKLEDLYKDRAFPEVW